MPDAIDRYPLPPEDPRQLVEQLRDIERRLSELEGRNPFAAGAIVRDGGSIAFKQDGDDRIFLGFDDDGRPCLIIYDDSGNPKIRAGELTEGGYGLEAIESNVPVTLASLGFGVQADFASGQVSTSSTTVHQSLSGGPEVTLTVPTSGKVLLMAGALLTVGGPTAGAGGRVEYQMSGANTGPSSEYNIAGFDAQDDDTPAFDVYTSGARLLEGLTPGSTTFELQYHATHAGVTVYFQNRFLIAQPY